MGTFIATFSAWIIFLLLAQVFLFLRASWPVWMLLVVSAWIWSSLRGKETPFAGATAKIAVATTVGLSAVLILELVFSIFSKTFSEERVGRVQNFLIEGYLKIHQLEKALPLWATLAVIALLCLGSVYLPKLAPLRRFLSFQEALSKLGLVLLVMTSFSFFSHIPLHRLVQDEHHKNLEWYKVFLDYERHQIANKLAMERLTESINALDAESTSEMKKTFLIIAQRSKQKVLVARMIAETDAERMPNLRERGMSHHWFDRPKLNAAESIMNVPPESIAEREAQLDLVRQQTERQHEIEDDIGARHLALREAFVQVVGLASPELEYIAGAYIDEWIDKLSEYFFDKHVYAWYEGGKRLANGHDAAELKISIEPLVGSEILVLRPTDLQGSAKTQGGTPDVLNGSSELERKVDDAEKAVTRQRTWEPPVGAPAEGHEKIEYPPEVVP